jgi:hypothetical protein
LLDPVDRSSPSTENLAAGGNEKVVQPLLLPVQAMGRMLPTNHGFEEFYGNLYAAELIREDRER